MIANLLLLLTAAVWGFGFVAQSMGMDHLSPFMFNGLRFLIGAVSLLPLLWFFANKKTLLVGNKKSLILASISAGSVLFFAASLQQVGLQFTSAANAGFITGLYIVIVPVLGLILKHQTGANTWLGCAIAVFGLYFLSIKDDMSIGYGDLLQLVGAVFWAVHILIIDHFAKKHSPILLSHLQFIFCGLLSIGVSMMIETTVIGNIGLAWAALAYSGIVSVGVGYTLQVVAQKNAHPAHVAIILSLETVFAAIGGILILGETLEPRALLGCSLMLTGILVSQIPLRYFVKSWGQTKRTQIQSD
ncbi:DMT family transporter [Shewanella subflava]|uniref:DMT family transporter n=1 Tax=Shewanella subflava TaxID=2986476 RepID=A0ABT3ICD2_9GAMM|nr:DMT family transporter [Shewanella subflava]MCW3173702.1 DMT family transporter [Shewanella subflava]